MAARSRFLSEQKVQRLLADPLLSLPGAERPVRGTFHKVKAERELQDLDARYQRKQKFFARYNIPSLRRAMEYHNKTVVGCACPSCYVVRSETMDITLDECRFVKAFEDILREQDVPFAVLDKDEEDTDPGISILTCRSPSGKKWGVIYTGRQLLEAHDVTDKALMNFRALFQRLGYEPAAT
jgi:hypothetical protein